MSWVPIVGKVFNSAQARAYIQPLPIILRPDFVVVHNTWSPTLKVYRTFRVHTSFEQWLQNLASYYRNPAKGKGAWPSGPHWFVAPDGVGAFTPMTVAGTHAPSWNQRSIGVETVGNFDVEPFEDPTKENLIDLLAAIHLHFQLPASTMRFHKEDPKTTHKDCPGKNVVKADLVAAVEARMHDTGGGGISHPDHLPIPAPVHPGPAPTTDPKEGSVEWLQFNMNRLHKPLALKFPPADADLKVDGDYGDLTHDAVEAFQLRTPGIKADGVAGTKQTIPAMKAALAKLPRPAP